MDGILIINKPKGCTSHDIVYKVKKMLNSKVGHTGTLDPNATGVLPLLIEKGTLCSQYLIEHDKEYEVELKLGIKTDSADAEGNIISEKNVEKSTLCRENVEKVLQNFIGKQKQMPPMYSAIKVNGKKLYEYARKGQTVEIEARDIEIYSIELLQINVDENIIKFKVHCSKGTYIRSLCEDIAEKLGTIGFMKELNRVKVGKFDINQAITIEELEKSDEKENYIISIEELFKDKQNVVIAENRLKHFYNGVKLSFDLPEDLYKIYNDKNKFVGIGSVKNRLLKREIVVS